MNVLLVADVHGNFAALSAVLADAGNVDSIWNLGDTVGYGPFPNDCLDALRSRRAFPFLAGNHDLAALDERFLAGFNPTAAAAVRWTARALSDENKAYLATRSPSATLDGVELAHGSPLQPYWEYILSADSAYANLKQMKSRICFVGHTHVPMLATLAPRAKTAHIEPLRDQDVVDLARGPAILNPGSVGQPRDGDPRASYAIFDTERQEVVLRRVKYDVDATQKAIIDAGLPAQLASRLAVGR